ncbi:MAG: hypothetical protein SFU56_10640 [Capsulimonadales bacterium]|nr:hypothetical protein [Capsulimonadales bacterium]
MSAVSREGQGFSGVGATAISLGTSPAGAAVITTVVVLLISLVAMFGGGETQRSLLTFSLAAILYASMVNTPFIGVPLALIYLSTFSVAKRYLIPLLGYSTYDPLILVQPVIISLFVVNLLLRRRLPFDTLLSRMIGILLVIMILEMANPLQGGIHISLAGALFYIIPLLWFYGGRTLGTHRVTRAFANIVIITAIMGVLYAFRQQFYGFTDVEKQWLELTKNDVGQYISNNVMRVFSFFNSFAEYTGVTSIAAIFCFVLFLNRNRLAIFPWLLLMTGIILSSSRGALLGTLLGCSLVWGLQSRNPRAWLPRLTVSLVLGGFLLIAGLNQARDIETSNDTTDALLQWQAKGILKAADARESTGVVHSNQFFDGVVRGFVQPLGNGLGTTTIAGAKFGVYLGAAAENDLGNLFISCGAFGGLLYLAIMLWAIWRTVWVWHRHRTWLSLGIVGMLAATAGTWLIGGRYSQCMIIWFLIGYVDRVDREDDERKKRAAVAKEKESAGEETAKESLTSPDSSPSSPQTRKAQS